MRILLSLVGAIFAFVPHIDAQSEYVTTAPIGKAPNKTSAQPKWSHFRPKDFAGKSFIFMPLPAYHLASDKLYRGYQFFSYPSGSIQLPYEKYVGKTFLIEEVKELDSGLRYLYRGRIVETDEVLSIPSGVMGRLEYMAFKSDVDTLREQAVGRTFFNRADKLFTIDEQGTISEHSVRQYRPYTVVSVVLSSSDRGPIRVIVKDEKGESYFLDCYWGFTNLDPMSKSSHFESVFLAEDPRHKHEWTPEIWDAIERGVVKIGFTKEQVELSWGSPTSKNDMSGDFGGSSQWVYENLGKNLYFDGNVLRVFQDN